MHAASNCVRVRRPLDPHSGASIVLVAIIDPRAPLRWPKRRSGLGQVAHNALEPATIFDSMEVEARRYHQTYSMPSEPPVYRRNAV